MRFSVYQLTHKGGRDTNEDRLGYSYTRGAVLLLLADGMGGHPEGEKAAEIAIRVITRQFLAAAHPALPDPAAFLEQVVMQANEAIVEYAQSRQMADNPRTTLVVAVVQDGRMTALHSGDSRLYWVRHGHVVLRSRDHSYYDKPELFPQLPNGVNRSVLFTCLGSDTAPLYDITGPLDLLPGDRLLLCSDGLWSVMHDSDLAAGLHGMPLKDAINLLCDDAVHRGGPHGDNVSLIGLEWEAGEAYQPTEVMPLSPAHPAPHDAFDDAEIERSIAEINDAIRRTAPRTRSS